VSSINGTLVQTDNAEHDAPWTDSISWSRRVDVAVACGDPETERRVLDAIGAGGASRGLLRVVRRCLSATDLLAVIASDIADVVVLGTDLHGLSNDSLSAVIRAHIPMIVLAGRGLGEPTWDACAHALVLPADATTEDVVAVLKSVSAPSFKSSPQRTRKLPRADSIKGTSATTSRVPARHAELIAVTGASRGIGCSTAAANLAAVIGRQHSTIVVEADLFASSMAGTLGLDPARNECMLAHEEPGDDAADWDRALSAELQLIDPASPHATVLCGVPRPALRGSINTAFVLDLLDRLGSRADFVIVDVPAICAEATAAAATYASILERADRILVVTSPDFVGLRRASLLTEAVASRPTGSEMRARLSLVLNRHRATNHPDAAEIAAVLRLPVAATVPDDASRLQSALELQRPVVSSRATRGSAARALEDLGSRLVCSANAEPNGVAQRKSFWRRGWWRARRAN
jgi:Flp pilus assembly CpaE family ATPase